MVAVGALLASASFAVVLLPVAGVVPAGLAEVMAGTVIVAMIEGAVAVVVGAVVGDLMVAAYTFVLVAKLPRITVYT